MNAWTPRHDWDYSSYVLMCNPPKYTATCRRCDETRTACASQFDTMDCPGPNLKKETT